jgi:endonuclease/exonuclease/phosphatase (EEP) superfamily protein YafD
VNPASTSAPLPVPSRGRWCAIFTFGASLGFVGVAALQVVLWLAPWLWIGEILQELRWHIGLTCSAAALALFLARAPRRGALALCFGALHLGPEARLSWPSAAVDPSAPRVVLITANVLYTNPRHDELLAALLAQRADAIALQELTPPLRRFLERELHAFPHRVFSPAGTWPEDGAGVALFARTPLREPHSLGLEVSYAPGLAATLVTPIGALRLRVVHLQRPGQPWRLEQRAQGLAHLERFTWTTRDVLLGDLNLTASSPLYARLLERTQLLDSSMGHGRQPSYWRFPRLPRTLGVPIDHVLHGSAMSCAARQVFELPGSDHGGVRVELVAAEQRR